MNTNYHLEQGRVPLLISLPHDGTALPESLRPRLTAAALRVADTDWHVGQLYAPAARALGASLLRPEYSRYVVDLNRPADGAPLYPGRRETGLCPLISFAEEPLYQSGGEPTPTEVAERVQTYWRPYHQALADELARLRTQFGRVLLWEGHSIRSVCPLFFEGRLTDFNFGTAGGRSAGAGLGERLAAIVAADGRWSSVLNGRFQGGYITRQYGQPAEGVHAVQLELSQICYMDEDPPFAWDAARAAAAQELLESLLRGALDWLQGE